MKPNAFKTTSLLAALMVFSAGATTVSAGEQSKDSASTSGQYSTGAPAGGSELTGVHRMSGTIDDIDKDKGIVDLKTSEGDLKLHFPPPAVANLKKGDQIEVELGLKPQQ